MVRSSMNWTTKRLRAHRKAGQTKHVYTKATADDWLQPLTGPAPTIACNGDVRWWWREPNGRSKCAKMSVLDTALLQTFPRDYKWPADVQLARKLIGNAVPPVVAERMLGGCEQPWRWPDPTVPIRRSRDDSDLEED